MKKFLKFCKVPLAIIAAVIFVAFLGALIALCALPHVKEYEYNHEVLGSNVEMKMTFTDEPLEITAPGAAEGYAIDKSLVLNVKRSTLGNQTAEDFVFGYEIKGDHLYVINAQGVRAELAEIDAFNVEFDTDVNPRHPTYASLMALFNNDATLISMLDEIGLHCAWSTALLGVSIAMVVLGGVLEAISLVIMILGRYGILDKKQTKQNA